MNATLLVLTVLQARLRSLGRFLAANAFSIFVLGPLIVGCGLWIAARYLDLLHRPFSFLVASDAVPGTVGLCLALLLNVLALPPLQREIFPVRDAGGYLDALPVPEAVRFHVALAAGWGRQVPVLVLLLVLLVALHDGAVTLGELASWTSGLGAAFVPLTLLGMTAVQLRVRLGARRDHASRLLAALTGAAVALVLLLPAGERSYALLPWWGAAAQLQAAVGQALAVPAPPAGFLGLALSALVSYPVALGLFLRYRRRDLERAEALALRSSRREQTLRRLLARLRRPAAGRALWTQVERDLLLIARRFSPAVYLAAGLALVLVAGTFLVVPGLGFSALWTRRAAVFASTAAALACVALVPLLLKHQLPRFWMEKSSAVPPRDVWGAKLWLARILALPTVILCGALLWTLPEAAADGSVPTLIALFQLVVAAWVAASTVGYTCFEVAARPVLGLIFSSLVGLALGGLFVFYGKAWWLWGAVYLYLADKLAERASRRIRFTEVES